MGKYVKIQIIKQTTTKHSKTVVDYQIKIKGSILTSVGSIFKYK